MASKEALAHLGMHPAWEQLRELVHEQEKKRFDSLTRKLLRGEHVPDYEIQYERGYIDGMKYLVNNPSLEAKKMYEKEGE